MESTIDDQIIAYAEYLMEEYGQTEDEALDNAIATGQSIIRNSHPQFQHTIDQARGSTFQE